MGHVDSLRQTRKRNKKIQTDGFWRRVRTERTEKIAEKGATVRWRSVRVIYIHLILGSVRVRESVWSPLWCLYLAKELLRESKREEWGVCKHAANVQTWVHTRSDEYALSSDKTRFISILYLFFLCCRLFVYGNIPDSKTGIDHSVSSQTRQHYKQHKPDLYVGVAMQATGCICIFSCACITFDTKFNIVFVQILVFEVKKICKPFITVLHQPY